MVADHVKDSDCTVDPETGLCVGCGVDHSGQCEKCSGKGYHFEGCPEIDGPAEVFVAPAIPLVLAPIARAAMALDLNGAFGGSSSYAEDEVDEGGALAFERFSFTLDRALDRSLSTYDTAKWSE